MARHQNLCRRHNLHRFLKQSAARPIPWQDSLTAEEAALLRSTLAYPGIIPIVEIREPGQGYRSVSGADGRQAVLTIYQSSERSSQFERAGQGTGSR